MPVVRAEFEAKLAAWTVLMGRPAFGFPAWQYQRWRMGKMIGVAQRNGECAVSDYYLRIPDQPQRVVYPPLARYKPVGARYQGVKGFPFPAMTQQIFEVPDHAKPSGFAGPVGRLGKCKGVGGVVTGLSKADAAMALEAFAALSFLAESSWTAVS